MKKFFSLLTLALLTMSAWAAKTVTIDFAAQGYTNGQEVTTVTDADELVTLTFDKGTNTNSPKYYNTGAAVRLYGGGTLTVSVADGSDPITGITFTFGSGDGTNAITSNVGTFNSPDWTGSANAVTFTVGGTTGHRRIAKVEVTLGGEVVETVAAPSIPASKGFKESITVEITNNDAEATVMYKTTGDWTEYTTPLTFNTTTTLEAKAVKGTLESPVVSATYTKLETIMTLKAANELGDSTEFYFGGNVVVVYKNGSNLWVRDETASGLIFGSGITNFEQGTVLNPDWTAKKITYQQIVPEFQNPAGLTASEQDKVTVNPVEVGISEINDDMMNQYIIIKNVSIDSVSSSDSKNFYANGMVLRNQFGLTFNPEAGKTYNIVGLVTAYKGVPQVYITEVQGDEPPTPEVVDVDNIDGAYALDPGTQFNMYNDVVVTYHNGKRLWIRDTEGKSGLIYDTNSVIETTFENGQVLSDGWSATYEVYNGLPEFTNPDPEGIAASGDTREAAPYERTDITSDNVNEYVILKEQTITSSDDRTYLTGNNLKLFDQFGVNPTIEEGKTYDVVGTVTIYNNEVELYIISVTEAGDIPQPQIEPEAGDYVKVTNNDDLTSGEYLIVYEAGHLAFDGGLDVLDAVGNSIEVEIVQNQLIKASEAADAAAFTFDAETGTLMSASGYYIGRTSDANGMETDAENALTNTLSINEEGYADIVSEGGAYLRYNSASNQMRFRYFKSSTYAGQKAIQLYKKVEGDAGLRGDVNDDQNVDITDVTVLIDYLLDSANAVNEANADANLDGNIDITDVTVLIDYLLNGAW